MLRYPGEMKAVARHLIRGAGRIFDIFPPPMPNPSANARMEAIWKDTGDLLHGAIAQFAAENGLPSPEEIRAGKTPRRTDTTPGSRLADG